jgi:hypothetical protein
MNLHMHRMMSHFILLNCLVIVIELLGAGNSKIIAYGLYILKLNYDVHEILTIVGCMQDEALQKK